MNLTSAFNSLKNSVNIILMHLDATALYKIENTEIGLIIIIISHDFVELLCFPGCIAFAMASAV